MDMWSLGICLFYLLTGFHLFIGKSNSEIIENIKNTRIKELLSAKNFPILKNYS